MRSTAFDTIDDPNDPAWAGHAVDAASGRRRRFVLGAAVAATAVALALVLFAVLRGGADAADDARGGDAPRSNLRPSAIVPDQSGDVVVDAAPITVPEAGTAARTQEPASSGWAPAQATVPHWSTEWLEGDLAGVAPIVADRLEIVARSLGTRIEVISGWRSTHEQNALYRSYLAGTGNLAAPPGLSKHEDGFAADVYVDGVALANVDGAVAAARSAGLHFPVPGEPWHAELIGR